MGSTFWWLLTIVCLVWYSTITLYVAVRGATDIKEMLARLRAIEIAENDEKKSS